MTTLNKEEREAIVAHRLKRAEETLAEAKGNIKMQLWHGAANRLYYACYYAVSGLLINNGYTSRTHSGVFSLLGEHFVSRELVSREQNKLYRRLLELRQGSDYDDWFDLEETDIQPLVEPAEKFIRTIETLVFKK